MSKAECKDCQWEYKGKCMRVGDKLCMRFSPMLSCDGDCVHCKIIDECEAFDNGEQD